MIGISTDMLELSKLRRSFKMLAILRHF